MGGIEALVRVRKSVAFIKNQVLMQERSPSPPVPDNEDGCMADGRASNLGTVPAVLQNAENGVAKADKSDDDGYPQLGKPDRESISHQQSRPGNEMAPLPQVRGPFLLSGRF